MEIEHDLVEFPLSAFEPRQLRGRFEPGRHPRRQRCDDGPQFSRARGLGGPFPHRFARGLAQQGHDRGMLPARDGGKRRQHRGVLRETLPAFGRSELIGHGKRLNQPFPEGKLRLRRAGPNPLEQRHQTKTRDLPRVAPGLVKRNSIGALKREFRRNAVERLTAKSARPFRRRRQNLGSSRWGTAGVRQIPALPSSRHRGSRKPSGLGQRLLPEAVGDFSLAPGTEVGHLFGVKSTYTIKELQRETAAAVRAAEKGSLVTITRHDRPVVHVISDERLGALLETMELLTDPDFVTAWQQEKAGQGKYYPASSLAG